MNRSRLGASVRRIARAAGLSLLTLCAAICLVTPFACKFAYDQDIPSPFFALSAKTAVAEALHVEKTYVTNSYYEGLIWADGMVDSDVLSAASSAMTLLPQEVTAAMAEDGWTVHVTAAEDLNALASENGVEPAATLAGLTVYSQKRIYVKATSSAALSATLHEVGHYVDYKLGFASQTAEFAEIFEAEREAYAEVSEYGASSAAEFFASAFNDRARSLRSREPEARDAWAFIDSGLTKLGVDIDALDGETPQARASRSTTSSP
jgi:hypothetical protein